MLESFVNKVACVKACNFIKKETLAQLFSCKYCEIFKNSFFIEHLWWLLLYSEKIVEIKNPFFNPYEDFIFMFLEARLFQGLLVSCVKARSSGLKTNEWLQGQLSLSSFRGHSNEYQGLLGN